MSQISIILPTYNVEKYIARALDSCINQTFKDIEIIVVDDCGSDKSIDIAKEYASKDERIKIIHNKENLKLLRARYEGVKVANSPYIMFLDPDDYLEIDACEECMKILDQNNNVDLVCFNYYECGENINKYLFYITNDYSQNDFYYFLFYKYPLFSWNIFNKLLKRELYIQTFELLQLNVDDKITMAEDFLLNLYYIQYIKNVSTTEKCIYNYNTLNINSSTREKFDKIKIASYVKDLEFVIKKIYILSLSDSINKDYIL
ncbi:glycosyltransferase family 2 protein, partial [Campylobacter volucris]|uniref:glycosyltransferase family 2 protein n=1 Tax=Campylobacter volucris TaxID=1031542 RepID=UPI00189D8D19